MNFDDKVQLMPEKRIHKHGNMLPISICNPSNCSKIILLESPHNICFKNVCSKLLQQSKYRYLENLLTSIEKISYFTFSNNSNVVPRFQILFLFLMMWRVTSKTWIREYFAMYWHASIFVRRTQRYQNILYVTTRICKSCSNRIVQSETCV